MGRVIVGLSISLDGFIAGPGDDISQVFAWMATGDTEFRMPNPDWTLRISAASAAELQLAFDQVGALLIGRRTFDLAQGWRGRHPVDRPVVIPTRTVPAEWANDGKPFTFVTDGIASAVAQAKAIAGEKNVSVAAASTAQQCIQAGLLDEIHLDLVPVLLGDGVRLFEHLGTDPIALEPTRVVAAPNVTHLTYRIVK